MEQAQITILAEANFENASIRLLKEEGQPHPYAYWVEVNEGMVDATERSGLYDALAAFSEAVRFEELER